MEPSIKFERYLSVTWMKDQTICIYVISEQTINNIIDFLAAKDVVRAIKEFRGATGADLYASKHIVDKMRAEGIKP